jgi:hypothetical protein
MKNWRVCDGTVNLLKAMTSWIEWAPGAAELNSRNNGKSVDCLLVREVCLSSDLDRLDLPISGASCEFWFQKSSPIHYLVRNRAICRLFWRNEAMTDRAERL